MQTPFVFSSTHAVQDGDLERLEAVARQFTAFVADTEPDVTAFHVYVSEDGSEVTNLQVHPDAASMDRHLQLAGEQIHQALGLAETRRIEVYGEPGPVLRQVLRANAEAGVEVRVAPTHVDGVQRAPVG